MGYSNNPGGRRKYDKGAKELMGEHTVEAVQFWIAIMRDPDEDMSHRMRASENIAWGFLGKPSQQVFAAHAHVKLDELPADTSELNRLAAGYAAMIGAEPGSMPPMIDVTPSDSRTSRTVSPRDDKAWIDELRQMAADEEAEQARPQTRLERLQRRQQQQPREPAPRSQRIVRRRRD
jgi:hypothetical protein